MKKIFLEITVDRLNEKWPWIFEQILLVFHKVFNKTKDLNNFSFEITKIWNRIRFFVICPVEYKTFLKNQIYAHYTNVEINEIKDYLDKVPNDKIYIWRLKLKKHNFFSLRDFTQDEWKEWIDPFSSITSALSKTWKYTLNTFQVNFKPIEDKKWKNGSDRIIKILESSYPNFLKKIILHPSFIIFKILFFPFIIFWKFLSLVFYRKNEEDWLWEKKDAVRELTQKLIDEWKNMDDNQKPRFYDKLSGKWFRVTINLIHAWEDKFEAITSLKEIAATMETYSNLWKNLLKLEDISNLEKSINLVKSRTTKWWFILTSKELSWLVHLPTTYVKTPFINWVSSRAFEPPSNLPIIDPDLTDDYTPKTDLTPIWKTNFRWTSMSFGIWPDDRRRHMYIIWKTGMWKSVLLENMILDDIKRWRGVAVIDPHWDLVEAIIGHIPKSRTNQTIIFDPSDVESPIAFNMLEDVNSKHRAFIASGLVWIFKRIFWMSWWPRLEHILRNTILALIEYPNTTMLSIPLMLTSDVFRSKVVNKITDPIVKKFWTHEFAKMPPNQKVEASGPILNKVWQFLSSTILRNILWQPKNSFSVRWAMDNKKIIIINLSKWKIWEDASSLLWAMMITKFQLDAMSRADIVEKERKDFYLYVDEFQNFATDSFATILSEARKYKLNLVMANQYIDQMTEEVKWAVFGNVWSIVSFQVWYHDANILKEVFSWEVLEDDLTNLKKYTIYLKQLIDGMPSKVFSAWTFPPYKKDDKEFKLRYKKILNASRERYCKNKKFVEQKINQAMKEIDRLEKTWEIKKEEFKKKKEEEKRKAHMERIKKQENKK